MANNPYVNKVDKADGTTIMDITDTTAVEGDVETGKVFYKASGARSIGTGTGGTGKLDQIAAYEEYSASSTYDLDDVVVINSRIWQCTTPISTPEEWTESHWTETSIDEQKADRADVEELSNVCVEFDVTIASTDWSSSSPYTYTWYNNAVGANSKVVVLLNDGAEAAGIDDFTYDKVTGGVQFTTDELPVGNLPLHIQIVEVVEMESYDIDIPVTIAVSDWSDTSPYTYTYSDSRITDGCSVEVYFADGAENCDVRLLDYAKGTNSVTITADVLPAQSLPVIIHIENMDSTGIAPLTASEVSTDAVQGQTTVQGALGALVNDKADKVSGGTTGNVAKLDSNGGIADSGYTIGTSVPSDAVFTDTVTEVLNVLNSDSTTSALSAAQGKALNSKIAPFFNANDEWINNTDIDTIQKTGLYPVGSGNTHAAGSWGVMFVIAPRADIVDQIHFAYGNIFIREYRSSTGWTQWYIFARQ